MKCDGGRANREASAFDMGYWVERNFCTVEDDAIDALAPASNSPRAELLADPVLAELHAAAVAWHRAWFDKLMAEELWRSLFGRLLMTPPTRALSPAEAAPILAHALRARSPAALTPASKD